MVKTQGDKLVPVSKGGSKKGRQSLRNRVCSVCQPSYKLKNPPPTTNFEDSWDRMWIGGALAVKASDSYKYNS